MPNATQIDVMIVADQAIMRDGLRLVIEKETDLIVVCEAANQKQATELFKLRSPSVTVIDLQIPAGAGVQLMHALHDLSETAALIVLSTYSSERQRVSALAANHIVSVPKIAIAQFQLIDAIRSVARHVNQPE
jgi:DNA-binding NarL/FixJ family response regulator